MDRNKELADIEQQIAELNSRREQLQLTNDWLAVVEGARAESSLPLESLVNRANYLQDVVPHLIRKIMQRALIPNRSTRQEMQQTFYSISQYLSRLDTEDHPGRIKRRLEVAKSRESSPWIN